MLGIGFKVSDTPATAVTRSLKELFSRDYAAADADAETQQAQALEQFQQLHQDAALVRTASAASRRVLLRYTAQLERMVSRFPADIGVAFSWNDSFCPRKKTASKSLHYEKKCVLFNLGALESQLGVQTDRADAEGLKAACAHFMRAAGAFSAVRAAAEAEHSGDSSSSPDMSLEGLGMLTSLMLAQAQACFYEKAIKDQMKDAIKAKLVHQAFDYYSAALDFCQSPVLSGTIDRLWGAHVLFQVRCMKAATQFWQAKASKELALSRGVGYGEEIARLQLADAACADALKVGAQNKLPPTLVQSATALQRVVQDTLQTAKKDNSSIYLDKIPPLAELPDVGKASMVKPLPPTADELAAELRGVDLFEKVVPSALLQRATQSKREVGELLEITRQRVAATSESVKMQLHALGLPAAIEAFERTIDDGISPGIWRKVEHVQRDHRNAGASAAVEAMQSALRANDAASDRAEKQLRAVETRLSAEEVEDNVCRQNYGVRWPRPPSATLNDGFRLDIDRYYRLVKEAKASDKVVAGKLESSQSLLALLSQPKLQLDAQLPKFEQDTSSCRDEIQQVSTLLLQLSGLMEEKAQVVQDFTASHEKFNVLPILQRGGGISADPAAIDHALADEKQFFQEHFVAKVDAICADETALLVELAAANAQFEAKKSSDTVMLERQAFLQKLGDAVDTYEQLQSHLKEGAKFYEELSTRIGQLQQTVDDHCAARELERRELELHVHADDAVRQREAHDAAVAAQMMRDMQLRDDSNVMQTASSDAALARQLAGGVPQTFQSTQQASQSPPQGLYNLFPSAQQQQQQPPPFVHARLQQQSHGGQLASASAPAPPQHPFSSYQQQTQTSPSQPPPAYSSIFSSSPSSTPQFGNYYYAQQQQSQPQNQPNYTNSSSSSHYQYPGAAYNHNATQGSGQSNFPRPPGGSV